MASAKKIINKMYLIDLTNSRKVLEYIHNHKGIIEKTISLFRNNIEVFTKIFGPPNGRFKGESISEMWIREFKGKKFVIFSGKKRGSSYEIEFDDIDNFITNDPFGDLCVEFLDTLLTKMKSIGVNLENTQ
jgi:hypothetical protein